MKSHIPGLFALLLMFASCKPTVRFGTHSLEQVVKTMSLGEKSSIIMGYAMEGTDSLYKTAAIERLGIPSVVISDKRTEWEFDAGYLYSWNTALMENLGYDAGRLRSREGIEIIREPHPESVSALYNHKDSHVQVESMRKSYTRGFERGFRGTFLDTAFIINGSAELQRSIQDSVTNGELAMADLDERVMAALTMISRSVANRSKVISNVDSTKHQVLIDLLNAESAVLLRNAGTLPLSPSHKRIALYGVDSYEGLDTELEKSGFTLEPSVKSYTHSVKGGAAATRKPFQYRADAIAAHLAVITFISPEMETAHEELISSICTAFHEKNKNVVLLLSVERPKSLSPSVLQAGAVLYIPELDSNKYKLVVDILTGVTNPSGKLFDACIDKAAGRELFPFGYGLGYSDFESSLSAPALMEDGTLYSVTVTNRGEYPGKYVVPFYSTDAAGSRQGEFLGFGKTGMLRPHESQTFQYALKSAED